MRVLFLTIFPLFLIFSNAGAHPVHVSICNIEIENNKIQLSVKMFQDDFLLAINHNFAQEINLEKADEEPARKLIDSYFKHMFNIVINQKDSLDFNYINSELNEDAIWLHYECEISKLKMINITNLIFLDLYYDQTNLVIVNYEGAQNGYRFNYKNQRKEITLNK